MPERHSQKTNQYSNVLMHKMTKGIKHTIYEKTQEL